MCVGRRGAAAAAAPAAAAARRPPPRAGARARARPPRGCWAVAAWGRARSGMKRSPLLLPWVAGTFGICIILINAALFTIYDCGGKQSGLASRAASIIDRERMESLQREIEALKIELSRIAGVSGTQIASDKVAQGGDLLRVATNTSIKATVPANAADVVASANVVCRETDFMCADGTRCIQRKDVCDGGKPECADGSDERACKLAPASTSPPSAAPTVNTARIRLQARRSAARLVLRHSLMKAFALFHKRADTKPSVSTESHRQYWIHIDAKVCKLGCYRQYSLRIITDLIWTCYSGTLKHPRKSMRACA
eukprot:COSAG01_NODE_90_length_27307_cov_734.166458_29_plen_311_part_00